MVPENLDSLSTELGELYNVQYGSDMVRGQDVHEKLKRDELDQVMDHSGHSLRWKESITQVIIECQKTFYITVPHQF